VAKITIEVEVEVTGTYTPGYPASRDDGETDVFVEFTVNSWGCPAQTYGPPERCYPAEPMEAEVTGAWLCKGGRNAPRVELTEAEKDRFLTMFYENPPEPSHDS